MYTVNFQTLGELAKQSPFRPFVVELMNGERLVVDHPEALAFRDTRAIFIGKDGDAQYFDSEVVNRIVGAEANGSGGH